MYILTCNNKVSALFIGMHGMILEENQTIYFFCRSRNDNGKESSSDDKESSRSSSLDPWLRLAATPAKDAKKLETIQQQLLEKEKQECTFTPNTHR